MSIEELKDLIATQQFHHAEHEPNDPEDPFSYDGLVIYRKYYGPEEVAESEIGDRRYLLINENDFEFAGVFRNGSSDFMIACQLVAWKDLRQ